MTAFKQLGVIVLLGMALLCPWRLAAQEAPQTGDQGQETVQDECGDNDASSPAQTEYPVPEHKPEHETIEDIFGEETVTLGFLGRLGIAVAVVLVQVVLIRLMWMLFKWLNGRLMVWASAKIKPLKFKKLKLLDTKQIAEALSFFLTIAKYLVTVFQLYITLPIIFRLFSATQEIAATLFGYILSPLKGIFFGTIEYIPKLITIIVILTVTRYVLRAMKFFATHIEKERLVIPGFYPDWAQPTFNILRVLLYAFTVAIVYPNLPGADSKFFQSVSVFVGVIFSLGSSSAIGNLVAGMVITYMRPFKIGDFIKLKDVTGTVVEKSPFVVRIMNKKHEYITFPNLTVLTSEIINYNTSLENDMGLIIHTGITMGYTVPWPKVHEILIAAARKTSRTEKEPAPFVLQTALDDFYAHYEINVYTKEINELAGIYSELYEHIQDGFRAKGIDMTAPAYEVRMTEERKGVRIRSAGRRKA